MNFDMTLEGLNTLSEEAVDVAKGIESDTTIYIIGSEDAVRGDEVYTNYGLQYSQVANLADRLQELNSKIKVEFIDPDRNPTFISQYPDDNLTTGKVMISSEKSAIRCFRSPTCSASSRIRRPGNTPIIPR